MRRLQKFQKNLTLAVTSQAGIFPSRRALIARRPMSAQGLDAYALEQPVQLLHAKRHDTEFATRPDEAVFLQALVQELEPVDIPAQNLDAVAPAVGKDKQCLGKRVQA